MIESSYWIVLLPLLSSLVIFFFGRWLPWKGALLGTLVLVYGLIHSLFIFGEVLGNPGMVAEIAIPWFRFGIYQTELGVLIDGLTALMLVIVTGISLLVHIYSLGYMHGDLRFKRYYAYLSFFTFAMLFLVVSNNFLQIFMGWELVGLASYLLIGFWFEKDSASYAGRKAFMTNKIGDVGFLIAVLMVFSLLGTLNFIQVQGRIEEGLVTAKASAIIALFLFCGAAGKSAQFPFHIWLPDAMEGPTPVSAMLHAATMVAAGVYMVARTYFVFQQGPISLEIVAWFGGLTALMAAGMALVSNDIKRVLAFSTVSQLGYMMMAMGVGGRTAGMFHLATHAFFKALLFLGAGSVIHAVHTNDIREMGGLSKKMLCTFWTFSFAWIAISGVWPFSGFFSKDAILEAALHSGHIGLFWLGIFVATLTAFYMTRLYILVFVNDPRDINKFSHAHESPSSMLFPMIVLAFLALGSGLYFQYGININALLSSVHASAEALPAAAAHAAAHHVWPHWFVPVVSSVAAISGIVLSVLFYSKKVFSADAVAQAFKPLYNLLERRYYIDEAFIHGIVKPADKLAGLLSKFDSEIYDRWVVDGVGLVTVWVSKTQDWVDRNIVDRLVDIWAHAAQFSGGLIRRAQTGLAQNYILFVVFGFGLIVLWKLGFHLG